MSRIPYAYEKFMGAIDSLATSSRSIQERLEYAYIGIHTLNSGDFPEGDLRDRYSCIWKRLDSVDARGHDGTIRALCSSLNNEDASELAKEFLELHSLLIIADHGHYNRNFKS